jgi:hypothetical protein
VRRGRILIVTWNDSCSLRNGWKDTAEVAAMSPCSIESIGFVVSDTKSHVTLASSLDDQGHAEGEMCIPKGCIVRKRRLR